MRRAYFYHIRMLVFLTAVVLVMNAGFLYGQGSGDGGTESNFHIGYGARAMGLGSAFTALADDPTAVFWNPAGLENIYSQSFSAFYTQLIEGDYYFIGYALPTLNIGTFGVGLGSIGVNGIEQTDAFNKTIGSFDYGEYQAYLSYAKTLFWDISAGTSVRVLYRGWPGLRDAGEAVDLNDFGVGADFGFLYKPRLFGSPILQDWAFGLNVINLFAPQMNEGDNIDEFPMTVKFGIFKKIRFTGAGSINLLFDVDHSVNRDVRFHMGTEYSFRDMGMLRVGFNNSSLAFGAGVKYSMFQIDYGLGNSQATADFPDAGLNTMHRISFTINFGLNRDELFAIAEERRIREEERIITDIREKDKQKFIAEHLQQADNYFGESNYLDAIVEYQQVIGADPFHFRAKVMLDSSNTLLQKGFQNQQALAVQDALDQERAESDLQFIEEHYERGRAYLDKKQFTEALIEFNIALERNPDQPTVQEAIRTTQRRLNEEISSLLQRSRRELQSGNYSEALRILSDARLLGGDDASVLREIETLTQRIKLQDNIRKGLELYDLGEYNQALELFEQALKSDPDNNLVKQYYERSKIEMASDQEQLDPEANRRYLQGVELFLLGKYSEAITIWRGILETHPYNKKVLEAIRNAEERRSATK